MDVRLPNGTVIKGIPEGTPKDVIMQKAISSGLAAESDFPVSEAVDVEQPIKEPVSAGRFGGFGGAKPQALSDRLPEIGSAPELNEMSVPAFKASLGLLVTGDDDRLKAMLSEQFGEGVSFEEDEKGRTIVNFPTGSYALNKEGVSPQDVARGAFGVAAYTPAGRAASLPASVGAAAATGAAVEGAAASTGAGFEPSNVAMDAAMGGVGKIAEDILFGAVRSARGKASPEDVELIRRAEEQNIPLMTTDVVQPETLAGKLAQSTGEVIPVAGTGGKRAAQQAAREQLAERFITEYTPKYDEVVAGLKNQRNRVKKAAGDRLEKIKLDVSEFGDIGTANTVAAIDDEIARLTRKGMVPDDETVKVLTQYKEAIGEGQDFSNLRDLRTDFRERVKGDRPVMPTRSEAAINKIYRGMTKDLDDAVKNNLGPDELARYKKADAIFAQEAKKVKDTKIGNILKKGDITPENASQMLFSKKPSEIKVLYQSLDNDGRKAARSTVIAKAIEDAGKRVNGLTPNTLASELGKYQTQYNIMFKGRDKQEIEGLIELLNATRRAQDAKVATPTGQMLLGTTGGYAAFTDLTGTLMSGGSIGAFARAYESPLVRDALIRVRNSPKGSKAYDEALQSASESMRTLLIAQPGQE